MKTNNLYKLTRGEEQLYFTSLHRISKYLNKQRTQVEYSMLKKKDVDGWYIDVVDGKDIPWGSIDCDNVK